VFFIYLFLFIYLFFQKLVSLAFAIVLQWLEFLFQELVFNSPHKLLDFVRCSCVLIAFMNDYVIDNSKFENLAIMHNNALYQYL
jgi:hypothetical protein